MKKIATFLLVAFLAAPILESCSSEKCPAYRSNYPAKAVKSKGKKKDRYKD
jgi:hypothetical protein